MKNYELEMTIHIFSGCFCVLHQCVQVYMIHLHTRPLVLHRCVFVEEGERAPPTVKVRSIEAVEQEITAE